MKHKIFFIGILFMFYTNFTQAQMSAAQKVNYTFDTSVTFQVKRSIVWNLFKSTSSWDRFSNQFIISIKKIKSIEDSVREIKFANGVVRVDSFTQYDPINRFMVLTSLYPANTSISHNFIAITINAIDENTCQLLYCIKLEGNTKSIEYKKTLEHLKKELYEYLKGIHSIIK